MTQSHVTTFEIVTAAGALIRIKGSLADARKWLRENATTYPGAQVEEVTVTTTRRRVYRPRPVEVAQAERVAA